MPTNEERLTLSLLIEILRGCFVEKTMTYGAGFTHYVTATYKHYDRYWGYRLDWYDGPIYTFGFWFFCVYAMPDPTDAIVCNKFYRSWYKMVYRKDLK